MKYKVKSFLCRYIAAHSQHDEEQMKRFSNFLWNLTILFPFLHSLYSSILSFSTLHLLLLFSLLPFHFHSSNIQSHSILTKKKIKPNQTKATSPFRTHLHSLLCSLTILIRLVFEYVILRKEIFMWFRCFSFILFLFFLSSSFLFLKLHWWIFLNWIFTI